MRLFLEFDRNEDHRRLADVFKVMESIFPAPDIVKMRFTGRKIAFVRCPIIRALQKTPAHQTARRYDRLKRHC